MQSILRMYLLQKYKQYINGYSIFLLFVLK